MHLLAGAVEEAVEEEVEVGLDSQKRTLQPLCLSWAVVLRLADVVVVSRKLSHGARTAPCRCSFLKFKFIQQNNYPVDE